MYRTADTIEIAITDKVTISCLGNMIKKNKPDSKEATELFIVVIFVDLSIELFSAYMIGNQPMIPY